MKTEEMYAIARGWWNGRVDDTQFKELCEGHTEAVSKVLSRYPHAKQVKIDVIWCPFEEKGHIIATFEVKADEAEGVPSCL